VTPTGQPDKTEGADALPCADCAVLNVYGRGCRIWGKAWKDLTGGRAYEGQGGNSGWYDGNALTKPL
jgi:hypothetical protein